MFLKKNPHRDLRGAPRRKVLARASITHKKHSVHTYPCILKDLSETGCQLVGTLLSSVADRFYLRSEAFGEPRLCAVAWRSRHMIGAAFVYYDERPDA
jgi:hypothetical protein